MMRRRSQQKNPVAFNVLKCPPHQPASVIYHGNIKENVCGARSSRSQRLSYQLQTPAMRGTRPILHLQNAQSPINDKLDQESCLSFNQENSGGSILSSSKYRTSKSGSSVIGDEEAARQIKRWFMIRRKPQLTTRILRNLVIRQDGLDDNSLKDVLLAADKVIFGGRLSGRVRWEWSTGQREYDHQLLGTTALRPAESTVGGFETLIILSRPLLKDERFSRDLLLSAFLHELIHSYLFIQCGLDHAKDGGHTKGFQEIAKLIDTYFGQQRLHLCNMRANLDYFLTSNIPLHSKHAPSTDGQFWSRDLSPGSDRHYVSSTDEGYFTRDRSPCHEISCNNDVDEGYGSRDPSPGSPGSSHYYVVMETGSQNGQTKSQCAHDDLQFTFNYQS